LADGREKALRQFIEQYETVRTAERRGVDNPAHLRALPFRDRTRSRSYEWYVRSQSYKVLIHRGLRPLERASTGALRIADIGSGVGWLAYRLALRGHQVAAVDLVTNEFDGLGAHRHYDREFLCLQAEFDRLPFRERAIDLAIYNAAFHYAADYCATLREALRVLAPGGRLVIMDSPLYRDPLSGAAMVREREDAFERLYGFRGTAIRTEGFLTYERLATLRDQLALRWELFRPWYGLRSLLKPWIARLRGIREPARFELVIGRRRSDI
jgi:SAM-dependent methyltransferase